MKLFTIISELFCPRCGKLLKNEEVKMEEGLTFSCPFCKYPFDFWELTGSVNYDEGIIDLMPKDEKNWVRKPKKFNPTER